jgi:hypothetical protein
MNGMECKLLNIIFIFKRAFDTISNIVVGRIWRPKEFGYGVSIGQEKSACFSKTVSESPVLRGQDFACLVEEIDVIVVCRRRGGFRTYEVPGRKVGEGVGDEFVYCSKLEGGL